jgi:hypothetical protein
MYDLFAIFALTERHELKTAMSAAKKASFCFRAALSRFG